MAVRDRYDGSSHATINYRKGLPLEPLTTGEVGIVVSIGIAVIGGIFALTMKLPRLLIDLQKVLEIPLRYGSFALCMYSMGYTHNRPEPSRDWFGETIVFFALLSIAIYWLLVMCVVVARYVLADREERDRARSDGAAQASAEEEAGD